MSGGEFALPPAGEGVRLVLARHGQTPSNVAHLMDTVPPGPGLTDLGRSQADDLAERLSGEKVRSVHASRAVRAQETAAPVAARHEVPVEVVDGVHEIFVGDLEGRDGGECREQFERVYRGWHLGELDVPMPGGETGRQALRRFFDGATGLLEGVDVGTVVLVSHGAVVRLVAGQLIAGMDGLHADAAYLPNAGVITLEAADTPTGWHCVGWDGLDS